MDITKEIQDILKTAEQTWGNAFFSKMTEKLGMLIEADYIFIGKIDFEKTGVNTIGLWGKEGHLDDFYYALENTPCKNVSEDKTCIYETDVTSLFPKDELLIQMAIKGYIGTPLKNSRGEVFAIMVALFHEKITHKDYVLALFEVFAGRISAELEREEREKQLNTMNQQLESLVSKRTRELEQLLEEVNKTREILVEKEKIASLGTLVSGVAHEINTPLGVSITAASNMEGKIREISKNYESGTLKKTEMDIFIDHMNKGIDLLMRNLTRSADLISRFRNIAADQESEQVRKIFLKEYIDEVIISFEPITEKRKISINNNVHEELQMEIDPGIIYRIFSNLFMNAIIHGFKDKGGIISVYSDIHDGKNFITIENNGSPIAREVIGKLFEPFVTTRRFEGGTGLGLHIVYNLVSTKLNGHIKLVKSEQPVRFEISY